MAAGRFVERVLEQVAERMAGRPAWDGVARADLVGEGSLGAPRLPLAGDEFPCAWGRVPLRERDGAGDDEHAEFPGFGGAA